jgi:predicted N-acyltransferase
MTLMDFEIQIVHSIQEIGQEAWDRLGGGRPFASYRWYRFGETVLADNTPIYVVLSRQGEPVARGTFWLRRREQLPLSSKIVRRLIEALLHRRPLLICQSPLVESPGLILPEPPLRDAALETIAQVALEQSQHHRASFLGYVYLKKQQAAYPGWPDILATIEMPEPRTHLSITSPDFESYLRSLSRSTRKDYRRHRKRAADRDIKIHDHPLTTPLNGTRLEQAMTLIRNVERRHGSSPHPWARAMLKHAHMVDAIWLTAEIGERLVGCDLLFGDGDTWVMTLLGLDYEVEYVYFQLMYAPIRCAIEKGAQTLWGGSGAYEMKQRLGFQVEAQHHVVFAGRGPWFHRLGRRVAATEIKEQSLASP